MLLKSLKSFSNSTEKKIQLDIMYGGEVLLQVFKQADVNKWKAVAPISDSRGEVVLIFFNLKKSPSKLNFERFSKMEIFENFILVDLGAEVDVYLLHISSLMDYKKQESIIKKLLIGIYKLNGQEDFEIIVRAF